MISAEWLPDHSRTARIGSSPLIESEQTASTPSWQDAYDDLASGPWGMSQKEVRNHVVEAVAVDEGIFVDEDALNIMVKTA
jgi:hypothetical protein